LKSKILLFVDWFLPGYKAGGPIQSIANFVNHFGSEFEISIVTSNTDLGQSEPYEDIPFNTWIINDNYRIIYLDAAHQNIKQYRFLLNEEFYDTFYFNSLFSVHFALIPLWLAVRMDSRVVLAPRGMLGAGALNIKKRKKQLLLWALKFSGYPQKIIWQATAASERDEIKKCFGNRTQVLLAPNLSAKMPSKALDKNKRKGELHLFFLSRIAQKKNLKGALNYLKAVNQRYNIRFSIIGPIDELEYWKECLLLIEKMPSHIKVNYIGAIPNLALPEILKDEHVMLLPTYHENFGHVIIESFQSGCPVILSDQTPWSDLAEKKIGWDIALNKPADFVLALETMAEMDAKSYNEWSFNAYNFAKDFCNNEKIIAANRSLFTKHIN
jgi:glycosyltransferase involved in cell wall biosynthesis